MRRPGQWLRMAATMIFARQTRERVVDPIIADIQTEHEEAVRAGRWWRARWIRVSGYVAFWKAVGLCTLQASPRAVWSGIASDGYALGRTIAYALVAFVCLTVLLLAPPVAAFGSRIQNPRFALFLLPQTVPLSIALALPLGIATSESEPRTSAPGTGRVLLLAIAATLLAFAVMLAMPVANQAFRVALAEELGSRGVTKHSLPRGANELSLSELAREGRQLEARGFPEGARQFKRAFHIRLALPAATFVLSLVALGLAGVVRGRVSRAAAMIAAIALYWVLLAAGWNSSLHPVLSVWAPNVVLTAMSVALFTSVRGRRQPGCTRAP